MNVDLIFDLGLHKGEDSEFYLKKGFRVIAVEASEELCKFSEQRLKKYIDTGDLVILNYAIYQSDGEMVTFYKNNTYSVWGTIDINWVKRNERVETTSFATKVPTIKLDTLIKKFGVPYYLKVDIEGMDLLAIKQLKDLPDKPKYLSIESEKVSRRKLIEECSFLRELGYNKFKIINQETIDAQKCPPFPVEKKFVPHVFEKGSSGLFGSELPGDWMNYNECINAYKKIFMKYRLFGDYGCFNHKKIKNLLSALRIKYPSVGWYDTHVTF